MKRALIVLACIALLSVMVPESRACGDKFIVGDSAAHFLEEQGLEPGNVLIFADLSKDTNDWMPKAESLAQVGHNVMIASKPEDLRAALEQGEVDVVLVPVAEAEELKREVSSAVVIPYIDYATSSAASAIKKTFGHVLRLPATSKKVNAAVLKALATLAS